MHSTPLCEIAAYTARVEWSDACTYSVLVTCTLHHWGNFQRTLHMCCACVSLQFTVWCTDSVHCKYTAHRWVHWQCILHVTVYFIHTRCAKAVPCAPLLHTGGLHCAAGAHAVCVECTMCGPCEPSRHCCAESLRIAAIFWHSNVPLHPITVRVATYRRTDRQLPLRFLSRIGIKESKRGWIFIHYQTKSKK